MNKTFRDLYFTENVDELVCKARSITREKPGFESASHENYCTPATRRLIMRFQDKFNEELCEMKCLFNFCFT